MLMKGGLMESGMNKRIIVLAGVASVFLHGLFLLVLVFSPRSPQIELPNAYTVKLVSLPAKRGKRLSSTGPNKPKEALYPADAGTPPLPSVLSPEVVKVKKKNAPVLSSGTDFRIEGNVRFRDRAALLAWRSYVEEVSDRVQENYDFPAEFSPHLRAVVKVRVGKDGQKQEISLIQPSDNENFDKLVCLARINNTIFPPLPRLFSSNYVVMLWTCSP